LGRLYYYLLKKSERYNISNLLIRSLTAPPKQVDTKHIYALTVEILNIFVSLARADFVLHVVKLFQTTGLTNFFLGGLQIYLIFILFLLFLLNYVLFSKNTIIKVFLKSFLPLLIKFFSISIPRNINVNLDFFLLFILFEPNLIGILISIFLFLLEAFLCLTILLGLIFKENSFLLNSSLFLGK
jgi:hypothetical protein